MRIQDANSRAFDQPKRLGDRFLVGNGDVAATRSGLEPLDAQSEGGRGFHLNLAIGKENIGPLGGSKGTTPTGRDATNDGGVSFVRHTVLTALLP